jgi:hypothetical protein
MLTQGGQSERPRERRQSGVVDIDGSGGAFAMLARTWDVNEYKDLRHGRFGEIKAAGAGDR